jgi:hypothetical protein
MEWDEVIKEIEEKFEWKAPLNRDIPLFLQHDQSLSIKRTLQDFKISTLKFTEDWVQIFFGNNFFFLNHLYIIIML